MGQLVGQFNTMTTAPPQNYRPREWTNYRGAPAWGVCYACGQMGHYALECPQDPQGQGRRPPPAPGTLSITDGTTPTAPSSDAASSTPAVAHHRTFRIMQLKGEEHEFPFSEFPERCALIKESLPPVELIVDADLVLDVGVTVAVRCLIDTGAQPSTPSRDIFYQHYGPGVPLEPAGQRLVAVNGHELQTDG